MAGLEADVSSYSNQPLPASPLDTVKQVQGVQSNAITIDKQKLDLMNTQFGLMNQELSALSDDPSITKQQAADRLIRFSNTLKLPKEATDHMLQELQQAPSVKAFSDNALRRGMTVQEKLNQQYGTPVEVQDNKFTYQGVRAPASKGGGVSLATKLPVQIAPGTPGYNQQNEQVFEQPAGAPGVVPAAPPMAAPVPRPRPAGALPAERPTTGATGPTRDITDQVPTTMANRVEPLKAGPSPLFAEGKEAYTKAQLMAAGKAQAIKPAIQAYKLMEKGLASGPGTEQFTQAVAALKAWGLVDIKETDDPTVIRQEVNKKLANYISNNPNVSRSDAALAQTEASSPNAKTQILPALKNLTRDAIALDRVQMLAPQAFKGTDYQNFIKHQGTFPNSIDEKALSLDLMDEKERENLIKKMANQYKNGKTAAEKNAATKFLNTLKLAQEAKIYEID